jgi:hypothetical protein
MLSWRKEDFMKKLVNALFLVSMFSFGIALALNIGIMASIIDVHMFYLIGLAVLAGIASLFFAALAVVKQRLRRE